MKVIFKNSTIGFAAVTYGKITSDSIWTDSGKYWTDYTTQGSHGNYCASSEVDVSGYNGMNLYFRCGYKNASSITTTNVEGLVLSNNAIPYCFYKDANDNTGAIPCTSVVLINGVNYYKVNLSNVVSVKLSYSISNFNSDVTEVGIWIFENE